MAIICGPARSPPAQEVQQDDGQDDPEAKRDAGVLSALGRAHGGQRQVDAAALGDAARHPGDAGQQPLAVLAAPEEGDHRVAAGLAGKAVDAQPCRLAAAENLPPEQRHRPPVSDPFAF